MTDRRQVYLRLAAGLGAALIGLVTFACDYWRDDILRASLDPGQPFQTYQPPPAPDYGGADAWYLRPGARSGTAPADTFFIHSTTFDGGKDWLGRIDDPVASRRVRQVSIPNYAGPFSAVSRVYAPKYRQASLYAYRLTMREDAREARSFAYDDVARAFQVFVTQDSRTGPIIIAGVGQGAQLADRLAREAVRDPVLRNRIAALYLMEEVTPEVNFPKGGPLPLCERRDQARCTVAWFSLVTGGADRNRILSHAVVWTGQNELDSPGSLRPACVNPISGGRDQSAEATDNLGAANGTGLPWGKAPTLLPRQVQARCDGGLLVVSTPDNPALRRPGGWADKLRAPGYNLFYADIAADARARIGAWYGGALAQPITSSVEVKPSPVHHIAVR